MKVLLQLPAKIYIKKLSLHVYWIETKHSSHLTAQMTFKG